MHVGILTERGDCCAVAGPILFNNHLFRTILEREPMQIHFIDFVTAANLLVLMGIYRKLSIIVYQHKLMWADFAGRKGISANGKHAASI
jgi:hypothetical protein